MVEIQEYRTEEEIDAVFDVRINEETEYILENCEERHPGAFGEVWKEYRNTLEEFNGTQA